MSKERKAFNFFRSYFDVYNELNEKEKVKFMDALLSRQFYGVEPKNLKGMSKFAYISQKHNIDVQVKGYEDKTGNKLSHPIDGGAEGGLKNPNEQVQVQEEGKEKEEVQEQVVLPFQSENFIVYWNNWKEYKRKEFGFKFKSLQSEQASLIELNNLSEKKEDVAVKIIEQSLAKGWKGFFALKNYNNGQTSDTRTAE